MAVALPPKPVWNQLIKSGCRVFVGGNASVPYALIQDLIDHSTGFSDIEMVHMLALGDTRWARGLLAPFAAFSLIVLMSPGQRKTPPAV